MTDQEHAEHLARIQAERAASGRPPLIQSELVYRLLDAVLAANQDRSERQTAKAS